MTRLRHHVDVSVQWLAGMNRSLSSLESSYYCMFMLLARCRPFRIPYRQSTITHSARLTAGATNTLQHHMSSTKRKAEPLTAADLKKPKKDASLTSFFGAPKPSTTNTSFSSDATVTAESPSLKFDKEKWVASLKPEQKSLLKLEIDTLDPSWLAHLHSDLTTPSFLSLKQFLQKEIDSGKKVFPPLEDVYSWSRHTPLHSVKAVILGQDPYHNHNQAHGLCFSVRPPTPAPPSLKNMYIALRKDYPSFREPPNKGGLLTPWAEQGVLMLNTALTVRAHEAGSHAGKGWEVFTQKVIDTVVKVRSRGLVFLAWGLPAAKRLYEGH